MKSLPGIVYVFQIKNNAMPAECLPVFSLLTPAAEECLMTASLPAFRGVDRLIRTHWLRRPRTASMAPTPMANPPVSLQNLQQPRSPLHKSARTGSPSGPNPVWVETHQYTVLS